MKIHPGAIVRFIDTNYKLEGRFGIVIRGNFDRIEPMGTFVVKPIPLITGYAGNVPFHWEQLVPLTIEEQNLFWMLNEVQDR